MLVLTSHPTKRLYIVGAFENEIADTAWCVHGRSTAQPDPRFSCNAEETDTRLWLHAYFQKILVISPDTDLYHIGVPLQCAIHKEVVVQVSLVNSVLLSQPDLFWTLSLTQNALLAAFTKGHALNSTSTSFNDIHDHTHS